MSAVSIRLSTELATVECEGCGHSTRVPTSDRRQLLTELRGFLQSHGRCRQAPAGEVRGGRRP
jgi:RNase P subunit RPR2